jgi:antitoxin component YwqK of YwqJK toxin-antitoxin module
MENNFSGELIQDTDNGKIIINFLDGKKDGITKFISLNGITLSEVLYKNDEIHGELKQYYPNGKMLSIITYENGKQNGSFLSFFENGVKQVQSNYKDGKLDGKFRAFYEFGDIILECEYVNGIKHGKNLLYYSKTYGGGIYEISFYDEGLLNGDKVTFYDTGEVMSLTIYKDGKAQTYPKNYAKTGEELK